MNNQKPKQTAKIEEKNVKKNRLNLNQIYEQGTGRICLIILSEQWTKFIKRVRMMTALANAR